MRFRLVASNNAKIMETIGERLEEARKRKGISLQEAAEATKIRSDFLRDIEQNNFSFALPDIYKRGFLKNYARYLKLDADKILTDYSAQQLGSSHTTGSGAAELFGEMELDHASGQKSGSESSTAGEGASLGRISKRGASSAPSQEHVDEPEPEPEEEELHTDADRMFYIKIGAVLVATLALVFVVYGLVRAILGGSDEAGRTAQDVRQEEAADAADADSEAEATTTTLKLEASGPVSIVVRQQEGDEVLFRKSMSEGEEATIERTGAVDILFSEGENIIVETEEDRFRPSSSGTAKITIP